MRWILLISDTAPVTQIPVSFQKSTQMCYLCDGFGIIYVSWVQGCIKTAIMLLPNHLNFSKKKPKNLMFSNYIKDSI